MYCTGSTSPTNQPRTPFICTPRVPICLSFNSQQGATPLWSLWIKTLLVEQSANTVKKVELGMDRAQSHIWLSANSYMVTHSRIYLCIRQNIYDFAAPNLFRISSFIRKTCLNFFFSQNHHVPQVKICLRTVIDPWPFNIFHFCKVKGKGLLEVLKIQILMTCECIKSVLRWKVSILLKDKSKSSMSSFTTVGKKKKNASMTIWTEQQRFIWF